MYVCMYVDTPTWKGKTILVCGSSAFYLQSFGAFQPRLIDCFYIICLDECRQPIFIPILTRVSHVSAWAKGQAWSDLNGAVRLGCAHWWTDCQVGRLQHESRSAHGSGAFGASGTEQRPFRCLFWTSLDNTWEQGPSRQYPGSEQDRAIHFWARLFFHKPP